LASNINGFMVLINFRFNFLKKKNFLLAPHSFYVKIWAMFARNIIVLLLLAIFMYSIPGRSENVISGREIGEDRIVPNKALIIDAERAISRSRATRKAQLKESELKREMASEDDLDLDPEIKRIIDEFEAEK
jgi:hypothetical protein